MIITQLSASSPGPQVGVPLSLVSESFFFFVLMLGQGVYLPSLSPSCSIFISLLTPPLLPRQSISIPGSRIQYQSKSLTYLFMKIPHLPRPPERSTVQGFHQRLIKCIVGNIIYCTHWVFLGLQHFSVLENYSLILQFYIF